MEPLHRDIASTFVLQKRIIQLNVLVVVVLILKSKH